MNQETGEVGYAGITSPGNAPSAITVGALDMHDTADRSDDTVAPYSSRGPRGIQAWPSPTWSRLAIVLSLSVHMADVVPAYAERRVWDDDEESAVSSG